MKNMTAALLILFSLTLVSCGGKGKSGGGGSSLSTEAYSTGVPADINIDNGNVTVNGTQFIYNQNPSISQISSASIPIIFQASNSQNLNSLQAVSGTAGNRVYRAIVTAKLIPGYNGQNSVDISACQFVNP